ncbi:MAG: LysR family transcriptional regulator [Oceanospirillaceae bacterium]
MNFAWDDLKIFLAICEQGTLSAASKALKVSQPTVGRRLKALEDSLGTQLFDRLPDGVVLTAHGEQLIPFAKNMQSAASAVHRQQASFNDSLNGDVSGTVRISMYEQIAQFVVPHLPTLRKQCPNLEIEIAIAHNAANLSRREADISIRKCIPDLPDIIAKKLGHYHYAIYGSQQYVEQNPAALSEDRYSQCDWIGFDDEHVYFSSQVWLRKQLGKKLPVIRSNNGVTILDAMLQNCGLGILPCFVGDRVPQLQKLQTIADDSAHLYLLIHKDMRKSAAVRLMMSAIINMFEDHREIFHGIEH